MFALALIQERIAVYKGIGGIECGEVISRLPWLVYLSSCHCCLIAFVFRRNTTVDLVGVDVIISSWCRAREIVTCS